MVIAIIVAAGQGRRMQVRTPKQFLQLAGRPVIAHAAAIFRHHPLIHQMVIVVPEGSRESEIQAVLAMQQPGDKPLVVAAGGPTRQRSVYNGLLAAQAQTDDIAVIHDGVRPFVSTDQLTAVVKTAIGWGAGILAIPLTDTPKQVSTDGKIHKTLSREGVWLAQTPQAFRVGILIKAHEMAQAENFIATDDAQLVERCGVPVKVVDGSIFNIKITLPQDLALAEAILASGSWVQSDAG
jgi:2-C-methyl-D-erythritol 4-phosphate cytidylyltransferase